VTDTPKSDAGQSEEAGEIRAVFNRRVAASDNALSALTVEAIEAIVPADVENLLKNKVLARRVEELEAAAKVVICSYCGHETPRCEDRAELVNAMTEHVVNCPNHPLANAMLIINELTSCLTAYVEIEESAAPASSSPLRERSREVLNWRQSPAAPAVSATNTQQL
jgi:hypothetical protein